MEELNNCPICDETKSKEYISCIDYTVSRETFKIVQCQNCGLKFTNPRPNEDEIGKYYEAEEYISHSDNNNGLINKLYQIVRNYTIKRKVKLIDYLTRKQIAGDKRLLDIGCGTGEFLHASKQSGWNVTGIEPSGIARNNAEKKYNIVPLSQEGLFKLNGKQFDVITLWHVLEHIHQLNTALAKISELLCDNGILIIAVPNCNSWDAKKYGKHWAAWDLPRHLYHFTEKNIEQLLNKFGLKLKSIIPMKFDSYYVSLLSEKYKTGKSNIIFGFINGFISNVFSGNIGYSSRIYILEKNKLTV